MCARFPAAVTQLPSPAVFRLVIPHRAETSQADSSWFGRSSASHHHPHLSAPFASSAQATNSFLYTHTTTHKLSRQSRLHCLAAEHQPTRKQARNSNPHRPSRNELLFCAITYLPGPLRGQEVRATLQRQDEQNSTCRC